MTTRANALFINAIEYNLKGFSPVDLGPQPDCDECNRIDDPDEKYDREWFSTMSDAFFSSNPCESCSSNLGGDRSIAHALDDDKRIYHLEICVDCVQFYANGTLPND